MLWKTLFATIVELGIRSGLYTAEELTPPLNAPPGNLPRASDDPPLAEDNREWPTTDETGGQEFGEESEQDEDPLVEFLGGEPDAETEPSAPVPAVRPSEGNSLRAVNLDSDREVRSDFPMEELVTGHTRSDPRMEDGLIVTHSSSSANGPPEYDYFDRPAGEVATHFTQTLDDAQPVSPPPCKRQR